MEIVEISIEFPSGIVITDRATFVRDLGHVHLSERLRALLQRLGETEAPPKLTVCIDGAAVNADQRLDGSYFVDVEALHGDIQNRGLARCLFGWTKDQRQQFGRFCHSLTVVSVVGAVGIFHSATTWTTSERLNEAVLVLIVVVTFLQGMNSMNGE
ncbi:hypothetical protein BTH42_34125 [Burkholderia sp. SRS-W-2-2016]|uniref:hypothetical protein n=1 Tax=Burkholderia sp. SRS-W-2-2016 TaxID=1926878 RepID=UPI00094AE314|nr:hypothetical protein [Burkholderia sp. SRS-W-2-2016]OLL27202.1 hypothetical protein BTH42_34125 [Burkholderia sp. SRS-W-2-2016]